MNERLQNTTGFRERKIVRNPTVRLIHGTTAGDFLTGEDQMLDAEEAVIEARNSMQRSRNNVLSVVKQDI